MIMQNFNNKSPRVGKEVIMRKDDYQLLVSYVNGSQRKSAFDQRNAEELQKELKRAIIVDASDFPPDVIRLNSKVHVQPEGKKKVMEITLVTPAMADISQGRISVMAPIGTALIGYREGQKVKWNVPSGPTTFTIVKVEN
jgi:regulator of nucleoside diphosphate kinase